MNKKSEFVGWAVTFLVFISGFVVKGIIKSREEKGFIDEGVEWEERVM